MLLDSCKKLLALVLIVAFVVLSACTTAPTPTPVQPHPSLAEEKADIPATAGDVPRMTIQQLLQKMESNDKILIVDNRKEVNTKFEIDHIKGAVPVPFDAIMAGEWLPPPNREVVLYWDWPHEDTSARAALKLIKEGFSDIKVLEGGYDAWKAAGYPVETGPTRDG